ncbi:lipase [Blumeria hordei DH14]|uniref:Lipase n=1 Tax=Blumeria graminis f. sp. hordei (strain DH14) TaxID=546991 RepID=N1JGM7_BLUG1|nr:lipase [Blumeria hordei DH14]
MDNPISKANAQAALHQNLQKPTAMLLYHHAGSLKIGQVMRYTITYTPVLDRIMAPPALHLRIKNCCTIALRAGFMRGPYNISVAAYPATYRPNEDFNDADRLGMPEFEPNVRAGGAWDCLLLVPEEIRVPAIISTASLPKNAQNTTAGSVSWIVEIASQIIFSKSAAVNYDLLVGRDESCLSLNLSGEQLDISHPISGQVGAAQQSEPSLPRYLAQSHGIFAKSIKVVVEDTAQLWNKPSLPTYDDKLLNQNKQMLNFNGEDVKKKSISPSGIREKELPPLPQKKVHLVILTHGLHSNLGADMLFLKESIDATAKQAKLDAKERRKRARSANKNVSTEVREKEKLNSEISTESEDEEDVIVRGYGGNAARTEKGIKYLGKRLARYVLNMTYPDHPTPPISKNNPTKIPSHTTESENSNTNEATSMLYPGKKQRAYKFTSISFVAHSLGGLVQTYAVAYIQKHSPEFFNLIKPINFIALASPLLGLSNENPLYVKFALDFGLVGRTGQDLGLTWRTPTIARSSWDAIVSGISEATPKNYADNQLPVESKPLLQILPTGPAHTALKKFRSRTVYSNIVNDGIVPLRTSCLLFLDWQGLGKVEKTKRDNGLIGTVAEWGWAEITGSNFTSPNRKNRSNSNTSTSTLNDSIIPENSHFSFSSTSEYDKKVDQGLLSGFMKLFQPTRPSVKTNHNGYGTKPSKIYQRSQTRLVPDVISEDSVSISLESTTSPQPTNESKLSIQTHFAPPTTSFFESAGDLLKPPLPTNDYLLSCSTRPQTIVHDRVYHPSDIPLPEKPTSRMFQSCPFHSTSNVDDVAGDYRPQSSLSVRKSSDPKPEIPDKRGMQEVEGAGMRVEERIARAYHRDMPWRKVLVRLEPDAHNNMIVRRMFINAYGWPVIEHLCNSHFSDAARLAAETSATTAASACDVDSTVPAPEPQHAGWPKLTLATPMDGASNAARQGANDIVSPLSQRTSLTPEPRNEMPPTYSGMAQSKRTTQLVEFQR